MKKEKKTKPIYVTDIIRGDSANMDPLSIYGPFEYMYFNVQIRE